jgi:hypothetical protein
MALTACYRPFSAGVLEDLSVYASNLSQETVANQAVVITPGHYGCPDLAFDGAAAPNSDYSYSDVVAHLKTAQGSVSFAFSPDDFANEQAILGMAVDGATDDEFWIGLDGSIAGDPMQIVLLSDGVVTYRGRFGANALGSQSNFVTVGSDGSTLIAAVNGEAQTITDIVGANAGQWFASATDADRLFVGAIPRAALELPFSGKITLALAYNRSVALLEHQQMWQSRITMSGMLRRFADR